MFCFLFLCLRARPYYIYSGWWGHWGGEEIQRICLEVCREVCGEVCGEECGEARVREGGSMEDWCLCLVAWEVIEESIVLTGGVGLLQWQAGGGGVGGQGPALGPGRGHDSKNHVNCNGIPRLWWCVCVCFVCGGRGAVLA